MNKEKIYVFDLGNVIVKPMDVKMLYELLECKIEYDEFLNFFCYDKSVIDAHNGLISDDEHIIRILEYSGSIKSLEEYKRIFTGPIRKGLYNDTVQIIESLKDNGNKICLLSNLRKIDFEWFSSIYDISKFNELFLSYEMHKSKPDLEIYQDMIEKLAILPKDILFFDDNKNNIESAKKCGITSYCVTGNNIKDTFNLIS